MIFFSVKILFFVSKRRYILEEKKMMWMEFLIRTQEKCEFHVVAVV
jgi:hypothetical protein